MAFTTIPGGDLADIILLGSEAADTVVLNTSQSMIVDGLGGNDNITFDNPSAQTGGNVSVVTTPVTAYGGEGADIFNVNQYTIGSSQILGGVGNDVFNSSAIAGARALAFDFQAAEVNGNAGTDRFGAAANAIDSTGSQILGGADNDTIFVGNTFGSEINGNKNSDTINVVGTALITGSSVFGGKGIDTINLAAGAAFAGRSSIDGADGNDTILAIGAGITTAAGSTLNISGGTGTDVINAVITVGGTAAAGNIAGVAVSGGADVDNITVAAVGNGLSINGGDGNDNITSITVAAGISNTINGGAGADVINTGGEDILIYTFADIATLTGNTAATADVITNFNGGVGVGFDKIQTGLAGSAANFTAAIAAGANFSAAAGNAQAAFAGNAALQYAWVEDLSATGTTNGYLFFRNGSAIGTNVALVASDIIA